MKFFIISTCSILLSLEIVCAAPQSATVEALVARALAENAELKFYAQEVAAAKGQRTQAGLWKNPDLSAQYGERRREDGSGSLLEDGYTRSFALTQTFEFPGKGSLRKAIAQKNIEIAEVGLTQFRLALSGQVRSLAYQFIGASANAAAAEEITERSSALISLLRERPLAGTPQLLELRVIEGDLITLQRSALEFVRTRDEARIELNQLLGLPASQSLTLAMTLPIPKHRPDANTLILLGLKNNLQLKSRTAELERAVREVTAAKWQPAPDFNVGPFFSEDRAGDSEQNYGVAVSATVPLWDWNQGNIATAKARQQQADALVLDARRKVEAEIARRVRFYELAQKQLAQTPDKVLTDLQAASDLADRQYRTGAISVQLFLEVQRQFLNTRQLRNEAILEAWRNWLDLELLTGAKESGDRSQNSGVKGK